MREPVYIARFNLQVFIASLNIFVKLLSTESIILITSQIIIYFKLWMKFFGEERWMVGNLRGPKHFFLQTVSKQF